MIFFALRARAEQLIDRSNGLDNLKLNVAVRDNAPWLSFFFFGGLDGRCSLPQRCVCVYDNLIDPPRGDWRERLNDMHIVDNLVDETEVRRSAINSV
jgi:hypothetical protein